MVLVVMKTSSIALGNLRGVVIVIVIAFHSALAYLASSPAATGALDQPPYAWQAFPIVDSHRWLGLDIFCAWQDVSLMSLMFLLSGLFASGSLLRKSTRTYVSDRLWRIGVPFLLAIVVLSPLSFYPAYVVRTEAPSLAGFWKQWMSLPFWPTGPQWFLWQLLAVNLMGAGLYAVWPGMMARMTQLSRWAGDHPLKFFAIFVAVSTLGYAPLAFAFSPWSWNEFGPFAVQSCRPFQYIIYFFAGFALGSRGVEQGLLAHDGPLARRWWAWLALAVASFCIWAGVTATTFPDWSQAPATARLGASLAFPLACASCGFVTIAVFLRFAVTRTRMLDSLSANAYSMYLLHYVFVVWLQYALLPAEMFALLKVAIVLAIALVMSWAGSIVSDRLLAGLPLVAAKRRVSPVPR